MTQYDVIVVGAGNAALAAAVSAKENGAEHVVVLEKAPREMRGGNTHWSGGVLRFAFDDPREIGVLLPRIEDEMEDFYDGIQPYTFDDFHGDLMRVTSGQTDAVLSRILVQNSKDTVFWMNRVGNIRMEPATSLTGVRKGNKIIWARGLVVRAAHEGVGLSRSWFATVEKMGIEIRYGAAVTAILQDGHGHACGVRVRDDDGVADVNGRAVILGCGGFEANVQMRTQHIGALVGGAKVRGTPYNQGDGLRMAMAIGAMPWGQWRLPRHPDLRRLGQFRPARTHRSQQPPQLPLRRDDQPPRPALCRRGGRRRHVHLRQIRPRHPRRTRRQGLPDLRLTGRPPARAALRHQRANHSRHAGGPRRPARYRRQAASDPHVARVQRGREARRRRLRPHPEGRPCHQRPGDRENQLGSQARKSALLRLFRHRRHHRLRGDGRRPLLRQLSGRHRPRFRRHLRPHRRPRCGEAQFGRPCHDGSGGMSQTIIQRLAERVHSFGEKNLTKQAIELSRTAIIDTIGVTLAGSVEPCAANLLLTPGVAEAPGPCTLFGTHHKTSALDATFFNGTASHALDYDDFSQPMGGHQSAPLVAPLLAVAEERRLSGAQLIQSYVVGVETEIRLARSVNFHHYDKGWHPTATMGVFGAAAAVGHMIGLDAERLSVALAIAASFASGVKANFGTMVKPLHVGQSARNGLLAILLAEAGYDANPAVLEHKQGFFNAFNGPGNYAADKIFEHWADTLEITGRTMGLKQFPCCGSTHPAIAMMLALRQEEGIRADDV